MARIYDAAMQDAAALREQRLKERISELERENAELNSRVEHWQAFAAEWAKAESD